MVYAMHQIQVACLVHNGQHLPAVREILADIAAEKALLASATTEAGIGGDLGSSNCHVERLDGGRYRLVKDAPVIPYADDADVIVATAKRTAESPQSDQVLRREGSRARSRSVARGTRSACAAPARTATCWT